MFTLIAGARPVDACEAAKAAISDMTMKAFSATDSSPGDDATDNDTGGGLEFEDMAELSYEFQSLNHDFNHYAITDEELRSLWPDPMLQPPSHRA